MSSLQVLLYLGFIVSFIACGLYIWSMSDQLKILGAKVEALELIIKINQLDHTATYRAVFMRDGPEPMGRYIHLDHYHQIEDRTFEEKRDFRANMIAMSKRFLERFAIPRGLAAHGPSEARRRYVEGKK